MHTPVFHKPHTAQLKKTFLERGNAVIGRITKSVPPKHMDFEKFKRHRIGSHFVDHGTCSHRHTPLELEADVSKSQAHKILLKWEEGFWNSLSCSSLDTLIAMNNPTKEWHEVEVIKMLFSFVRIKYVPLPIFFRCTLKKSRRRDSR